MAKLSLVIPEAGNIRLVPGTEFVWGSITMGISSARSGCGKGRSRHALGSFSDETRYILDGQDNFAESPIMNTTDA